MVAYSQKFLNTQQEEVWGLLINGEQQETEVNTEKNNEVKMLIKYNECLKA